MAGDQTTGTTEQKDGDAGASSTAGTSAAEGGNAGTPGQYTPEQIRELIAENERLTRVQQQHLAEKSNAEQNARELAELRARVGTTPMHPAAQNPLDARIMEMQQTLVELRREEALTPGPLLKSLREAHEVSLALLMRERETQMFSDRERVVAQEFMKVNPKWRDAALSKWREKGGMLSVDECVAIVRGQSTDHEAEAAAEARRKANAEAAAAAAQRPPTSGAGGGPAHTGSQIITLAEFQRRAGDRKLVADVDAGRVQVIP
jgi:hypothetical protein